MMIYEHFEFVSFSPEETQRLGRETGALVPPGTLIALTGDLGSGKTAFVQGLAKGLEVPEEYYVTSPTYTLMNAYPGRCPLFHVDLYRLDNFSEIEDIGFYDMLEGGDEVIAIEWAERLPEGLLTEYIKIHLEIQKDDSRKIWVSAYGAEGISLIRKISGSV
jgi:tRNA threonylcarbamoyladenosine biosynthesis protein TsaE